jgi:opacity protein-like surface antigen
MEVIALHLTGEFHEGHCRFLGSKTGWFQIGPAEWRLELPAPLAKRLWLRCLVTRRISWKLVLFLALFPASAFAQVPLSTGFGRAVSVSLGYSYLSLPIPSSTRIDLNGVGASITADFRPRFGAKIDLNYARQANVFSTGRHADVLTAMIGPVFYPVSNDRLTVYVQALAGASRITGVVPNGTGGFDTAYTDGLSWAMGGGVETRITSFLAVRTEADYLRTSFTNSSAAFVGQTDLRLVGSLVYRWAWHWEGRRDRRRFLPF